MLSARALANSMHASYKEIKQFTRTPVKGKKTKKRSKKIYINKTVIQFPSYLTHVSHNHGKHVTWRESAPHSQHERGTPCVQQLRTPVSNRCCAGSPSRLLCNGERRRVFWALFHAFCCDDTDWCLFSYQCAHKTNARSQSVTCSHIVSCTCWPFKLLFYYNQPFKNVTTTASSWKVKSYYFIFYFFFKDYNILNSVVKRSVEINTKINAITISEYVLLFIHSFSFLFLFFIYRHNIAF